jgi:RNA polymerase sigma-70 factor (ECF subfamily)
MNHLEKELESIRLKLELLKAIENLPDKIKRSFKLTKIEGLTYGEAASFLSISPKTIEKQVTRAYILLRKMKELKNFYDVF